jgi:cyclophilin family peptidyl-prolyl cis-trans isomerase
MKRIHTLAVLFLIAICSCTGQTDQNKNDQAMYDLAKISTPQGEIIFLLHDETPKHKASFIKLVKEQYFDSYTFNRVIDNFVAQGGCPDTPEGFSDLPYLLEPEFRAQLRHAYGAVGAGRDDNPEMLSAGCQFYIVQNKDGLHRLDNKYTVFGQVVKGMDVVDKIVKVETDSIDQPLVPISLNIEIIRLDSLQISKL